MERRPRRPPIPQCAVPWPVPGFTTVSVCMAGPKFAVTLFAASMVTVQLPVPEHPPPLQPWKEDWNPGVAVSVTVVPNT
jgi:hypothetical protein